MYYYMCLDRFCYSLSFPLNKVHVGCSMCSMALYISLLMHDILLENDNQSEEEIGLLLLLLLLMLLSKSVYVVKQTVLFHVPVSIKLPSKLICSLFKKEMSGAAYKISRSLYHMMNAYEQNCNNCQVKFNHYRITYGCLIRTQKDFCRKFIMVFCCSCYFCLVAQQQ